MLKAFSSDRANSKARWLFERRWIKFIFLLWLQKVQALQECNTKKEIWILLVSLLSQFKSSKVSRVSKKNKNHLGVKERFYRSLQA